MVRAAVREVVTVHRSHDNVIQAEIFDDERDVARFFRVQSQRLAFVDGAKTATARAGIAEDQKRCGLIAPAFANIRDSAPPRKPCGGSSPSGYVSDGDS